MSVQRIMGLQAREVEMPMDKLATKDITSIKKRYGLKENEKISMSALVKKLEDKTNTGEDFKQDFVLFACASILCPTSANGPAKLYLKYVSKTSAISQFNWAKIVVDCLIDSVKSCKPGHDKGSSKKNTWPEAYYIYSCCFVKMLLKDAWVVQNQRKVQPFSIGPTMMFSKLRRPWEKNYAKAEVFIRSEYDSVKNHAYEDRLTKVEHTLKCLLNKVDVIEDKVTILTVGVRGQSMVDEEAEDMFHKDGKCSEELTDDDRLTKVEHTLKCLVNKVDGIEDKVTILTVGVRGQPMMGEEAEDGLFDKEREKKKWKGKETHNWGKTTGLMIKREGKKWKVKIISLRKRERGRE